MMKRASSALWMRSVCANARRSAIKVAFWSSSGTPLSASSSKGASRSGILSTASLGLCARNVVRQLHHSLSSQSCVVGRLATKRWYLRVVRRTNAPSLPPTR
jgi:hypothetical protein